MTDDMTDKIAVIAGGPPEVAEATARLLATRRAAGLMVCGRGAERGQALAAIISAAGCPTHFLPVDLARAQDCAAVIAEADLVFGRIDVLIVGAGEVPYLPLEDTTPEKLDQLLAIKVRAPFLLLQGAVRLMRRTGVHGTLIIMIGGAAATGRGHSRRWRAKARSPRWRKASPSRSRPTVSKCSASRSMTSKRVSAPPPTRGARDRRARRRQCANAIRRDHRFAQAAASGK